MSLTTNVHLTRADLLAYADELGLDQDRFQADLSLSLIHI